MPASDEIGAGGDVAPLVGAADLKGAAAFLEQMQEVVRLDQHVAELGVAETGFLPFEAGFHGVLLHHHVDAEGLADIAQKVEERPGLHPVGVVDDRYFVGPLVDALGADGEGAVEDSTNLRADAGEVPLDRVVVEEVALLALSGWITDEPGGSADQRDGIVTVPPEMGEDQDR